MYLAWCFCRLFGNLPFLLQIAAHAHSMNVTLMTNPLTAGGLFLPETPNSLVERGYLSEARSVLQKVRGTKDVDVEFDTIVLANEALKGMENPWRAIFRRRNRPQLVLAIAMPFFQ